jgi:DNA replication licensing factor MCM2
MLESFISTQKFAVMRSLEKHFKKYMSFKKDSFELLLYILNSLRQEALNFARLRSPDEALGDTEVEIKCEELESRAAEVQVSNLSAFYASDLFRQSGYTFDEARRIIIKA